MRYLHYLTIRTRISYSSVLNSCSPSLVKKKWWEYVKGYIPKLARTLLSHSHFFLFSWLVKLSISKQTPVRTFLCCLSRSLIIKERVSAAARSPVMTWPGQAAQSPVMTEPGPAAAAGSDPSRKSAPMYRTCFSLAKTRRCFMMFVFQYLNRSVVRAQSVTLRHTEPQDKRTTPHGRSSSSSAAPRRAYAIVLSRYTTSLVLLIVNTKLVNGTC